jgi:UDP-N-acetylmuramoylalanine--D-glutamate ligase
MGSSGKAVARQLRARGGAVVAVDDAPDDAAVARASAAGLDLVARPDAATLARLVREATLVVPSPGVPFGHPVFRLAREAGVPVRAEVELAWQWARAPIVAVTGTNGKTTVTELIAAMLAASGISAVAAGNIGVPLSEAVNSASDVLVAEVSSFQLQWTESFHPAVSVWLNVAEDHLDWHPDFRSYVDAKARLWANQDADDTAVANADDSVVMDAARRAPAQLVTFALGTAADYVVRDGVLAAPDGTIVAADQLPRSLPHDLANSLAAAAAARAAGATLDGIRSALMNQRTGRHRLELVADAERVRWYDDSKATNPHAALAAVRSFESVVLLAGGRNKGLDLRPLAAAADRLRAVVAFGQAAPEVETAFAGITPVKPAASMREAVRLAADLAEPGDAVVLSPACASFDAYSSYADRGDDFAREVRALIEPGERR